MGRWIALAVLLLLAGCAKKLDGKYELAGDAGLFGMVSGKGMNLEFKDSGKVYMNAPLVGTRAGTYTIDEDKVTVQFDNASTVFTLEKDGSLSGGPMGATLKKVE